MKHSNNTFFSFLACVGLFVCMDSFATNEDSLFLSLFNKSIEELINQEVTIATKSTQSVSQTPSVVSIVTSEDIANMGARELPDVLQTIPGFELNRTNPGYYTMGVRGVKGSRIASKVLVMIDGMPFNQIFYGSYVNWGYIINLDAVERIEIIRGPGSALYGRNAFSAVINIITKNGKTGEKPELKASLGNFGHKQLSGFYAYSKNDFHSSVAVNRIYTDVADSKMDVGFGPTNWNLTRDNFTANANIGYKDFTFSGMYLNLKGGGIFRDNRISNNVLNYALSYNKQFNSKLSLDVRFLGHNSEYTEDIEEIKPGSKVLLGIDDSTTYSDFYPLGIYYTPHSEEYLYGIEGEIRYQLLSNNNLLLGIQADVHGVQHVNIKSNVDFATFAPLPGIGRDNQVLYAPGWFEKGEHHYNNIAFLVQDIWQINEKAGLTAGFRYDIDSEIGGVFNPRAGLVLTPVKNLNIKLLYGKAYRAPAPADQYVTLGYAVGNKDLKPEIINTQELVINYNLESSSFSMSLYRNQLKDMIYTGLLAQIDPENRWNNIGKNISTGVEFENKTFIGRNFYSYVNYSFTSSVNEDDFADGTRTKYDHPDIAPHKINAGINYLFLKHFKWNMNAFYRSKMDKFTILGTNTEVLNEIGNYVIFNSTLQISNLVKNITFGISGYNLLNTKYYSQDNQNLRQPAQPGRQVIGTISFVIN